MKETLFTGGRNHDVRRRMPDESLLSGPAQRPDYLRVHDTRVYGGQDKAAGGYRVAQDKGGQE